MNRWRKEADQGREYRQALYNPLPGHAQRNCIFTGGQGEREGIISLLSVRENLVLNSIKKLSRGHLVNQRREKELVSSIINMFGIKTASPEQEVAHLSGGNKQKVVVGRIASTHPKILLLDEPTKGVDISTQGEHFGHNQG